MSRRAVEGGAQRVALNMKATPSLRGRLEEAAAESGRSLTQEVEYRVETSFLFDKVVVQVAESSKAATVRLLADLCDGAENFSVGYRIAQMLSFYDLAEESEKAVAAIVSALPALMKKKALPLGGTIMEFNNAAMFEAAFAAPPYEQEHGRRTDIPTLPEGMEWEKPENLKNYKPFNPERDLFKSVIDEAKTTGGKDTPEATDKKKTRVHKKKS